MLDIERMSLKELRDLRTKVERAISSFEERKRREALAAVEEAAREHGFSLNELTGSKGRRVGKAAAKFVNPEDNSQTWSGRGRRPRWISGRA